MDAEEKDKILLQFLKSDKVYLQALLYAIVLGALGGISITFGCDLFFKDNYLLVKLIIFYLSAFIFLAISNKILNRYKSINEEFKKLKKEYEV